MRDAKVSAKAEVIKMREECEQEIKERRREQQQNEKRLAQREENLDRRADSLDEKLKGVEKQGARRALAILFTMLAVVVATNIFKARIVIPITS